MLEFEITRLRHTSSRCVRLENVCSISNSVLLYSVQYMWCFPICPAHLSMRKHDNILPFRRSSREAYGNSIPLNMSATSPGSHIVTVENFKPCISEFISSVGLMTGYRLNGFGSIPGRGKRFFYAPQRSDLIYGSPSLLWSGYRRSFPQG
jgi:hypothetical protein